MDKRRPSDNAAAIVVAILLLLTAWGNAWVLFAASGLALVGLLLLFRDGMLRDAALPATAAALVGVAVALAMILLLRR